MPTGYLEVRKSLGVVFIVEQLECPDEKGDLDVLLRLFCCPFREFFAKSRLSSWGNRNALYDNKFMLRVFGGHVDKFELFVAQRARSGGFGWSSGGMRSSARTESDICSRQWFKALQTSLK